MSVPVIDATDMWVCSVKNRVRSSAHPGSFVVILCSLRDRFAIFVPGSFSTFALPTSQFPMIDSRPRTAPTATHQPQSLIPGLRLLRSCSVARKWSQFIVRISDILVFVVRRALCLHLCLQSSLLAHMVLSGACIFIDRDVFCCQGYGGWLAAEHVEYWQDFWVYGLQLRFIW